MEVWVPDHPDREAIGDLPPEVRLHAFAGDAAPPDEVLSADFLIPGFRARDEYRELMPRMASLRVVQALSAGVDWLLPIVGDSVILCDAAGTRDAPVAEWILGAILAALKGFPQLRDNQREHRWEWAPHSDLAGTTVMILGYGSIGRTLESYLEPTGVNLLRVARHARPGVHAVGEIGRLLPEAQVVVVLVPLLPETRGLLDRATIGLLPEGALIVNAARGPVVDTDALLEALRAERVRAVLDVTDPEPLPADHPLWDAPGTFITPHYAGSSAAAERRVMAFVGDQIRRFARGEPLRNIVRDGY